MKLTEIFDSGRFSLSFEVFPPKNDTAYESVKNATEEIAKLSPSFMSVTYGAGGGYIIILAALSQRSSISSLLARVSSHSLGIASYP